jgi:hypothetical protein
MSFASRARNVWRRGNRVSTTTPANPEKAINLISEHRTRFGSAPAWNDLDPRILDHIITRLEGGDLIEIFAYVSITTPLFYSYKKLSELNIADSDVEPSISGILLCHGSALAQDFTLAAAANSVEKCYLQKTWGILREILHFSAIFDRSEAISSYYMAVIYALIGQPGKSLEYSEDAIQKLYHINKYGTNASQLVFLPPHLKTYNDAANELAILQRACKRDLGLYDIAT